MKNVSAIIPTKGERPSELQEIQEHLRTISFIDDIVIIQGDIGPYRRYNVSLAKHDTIYVQDDDCIVQDIQKIYDLYDNNHITLGMTKERFPYYQNTRDKLVGWGAFFDKSWVNILKKYIDVYGEDYLYKREADRIFTYLYGKSKMIISDIKHFPSANHPMALSWNLNHGYYRWEILNRCKKLMF